MQTKTNPSNDPSPPLELCPKQREAVEHGGHLILLGGAGSGKTLMSVLRMCEQMVRKPSAGFLYVAFSRSLVEKTRGLFDQWLSPKQARRLTIATQHALCARILREHGDRLGFRIDARRFEPQVIQDDALLELLPKARQLAIDALAVDGDGASATLLSGADLSAISAFIQVEKRLGRLPEASLEAASEPMQRAMAATYAELQRLLKQLNRITKDDMLMLAAAILRECPEVAAFYQSLFSGGITIDEAQDSSALQLEIDLLLAHPTGTMTLVGDPMQTVFSYLGALGAEVFERFQATWPSAKTVYLTRNLRCDGPLVAFDNLYADAYTRQEAVRAGGAPITFRTCADPDDEASWVAAQIREAYEAGTSEYGRMAVLARTRDQLIAFATELLRQNIPCIRYGKGTFWDQADVKFLVACLTLSQDIEDAYAFKIVIGHPFKGLTAAVRTKLRADDAELRWFHLLDTERISTLSVDAQAATTRLRSFLEALTYVRDLTPVALVDFLLLNAELATFIKTSAEDERQADERLGWTREFRRLAQGFATIPEFLDEIAQMSGQDPFSSAGRDRVQLLSMHDAKGSEFDVVFLTGVENDLVPHRLSRDSAARLDEELRLFRMAVKRARHYLVVTYCRERAGLPKDSSIFLRSVLIPKHLRSSTTQWRKGIGDDRPTTIDHRSIFNGQSEMPHEQSLPS